MPFVRHHGRVGADGHLLDRATQAWGQGHWPAGPPCRASLAQWSRRRPRGRRRPMISAEVARLSALAAEGGGLVPSVAELSAPGFGRLASPQCNISAACRRWCGSRWRGWPLAPLLVKRSQWQLHRHGAGVVMKLGPDDPRYGNAPPSKTRSAQQVQPRSTMCSSTAGVVVRSVSIGADCLRWCGE